MQVTDGVQSLEAMEYQSIPALSTALRFGILIAVFFFSCNSHSIQTNVLLFTVLIQEAAIVILMLMNRTETSVIEFFKMLS